MIAADVHVHSAFSPDSKSDVNFYIEKAINLDFHTICITDHYDINYIYEKIDGGQFVFDTEFYFKKLNGIKEEYKHKIKVLTGIEMGLLPRFKIEINEFLSKYRFDFVIGSSHFIGNIEPSLSVDFWKNYNEKEAFYLYFESILENVKMFKNYDVYGHLDYVVRYAPNKNKEFEFKNYEELFREILKHLIKNHKGLEINTGGLRSGLSYPHPHKDILKLYKLLGGEIITIGSDAHDQDQLGYKFKIVENLMKEIGFEYYAVYKNRIPKFYKI